MDQDFVAIITYPCPRCGVGLEALAMSVADWLRCPACGKGGLPPFPSARPTPRAVAAKVTYDPDVLYIGEEVMNEPETPWFGTRRLNPVDPARTPETERPGPSGRTALTVLFSLCLSVFTVLLFVGDNFRAGLFGVGAGLFLLMLVRPNRRP